MSLLPAAHNLFVIDIEYVIPRDEALPHLEAHMAFIRDYMDKGVFLVSGPKEPLSGGVIIALAKDRDTVEAIADGDPLFVNGCTRHHITEFKPTSAQPGLK